jgi:hypothetical protein
VRWDTVPHDQTVAPVREPGEDSTIEQAIGWAQVPDGFKRDVASPRDGFGRRFELCMKPVWVFKWQGRMSITVNAHLMPVLVDFFHQVWVLLYGFSNQKECGLNLLPCQRFKHLRCIAWMGAIVKGEGDFTARFIAVPEHLWVFSLHGTIILIQAGINQFHFELVVLFRFCPFYPVLSVKFIL